MRRLIFLAISVLLLFGLFSYVDAFVVQYQTLASFDFLSASEVSQFQNTTLAGEIWNSWNTTQYGQVSYSVANGKLNITSTSGSLGAKEGILLYPTTWKGYVEVTLSQGVIGIFHPANSSDILTGYEVVKTASGVTVYQVNGSSKTSLASLTTTQNVIVVTVDGSFKVNLGDGTGVYSGGVIEAAVLGLGTEAGSSASFDKVVLYGEMLAGTNEIDLGTQTVTAAARVAAFNYDASGYSNVKGATLIVTLSSADDPYLRYYIIATSNPGNTFWQNPPANLKFGTIRGKATVKVDILQLISSAPTGTFYIGVSTFGTSSWTISAKIVLDVDQPQDQQDSGGNQGTTTEQNTNQSLFSNLSENTKYLLLGLGIIFVMLVMMTFFQGGRKRGGMAPIAAVFILLLVFGGIAAAVLAWFHPEYLTALAFGLGAIALIALLMLLMHGRNIPNPLKQ